MLKAMSNVTIGRGWRARFTLVPLPAADTPYSTIQRLSQ